MRIAFFLFGLMVLAGSVALPQSAPQTKTAPAAKKTPVPAAKKAATTKTGAPAAAPKTAAASPAGASTKKGTGTKTGTTKTSKASKTGKSTKKGPPPRRTQLAPTPERYKDIQSALIAKGYLQGEPSGVWDSDSMDAMRRFQTDQKQTPTGKITAPALIGLGLGPKPPDSEPAAPNSAAPPVPQQP
jgi:hypothetical protein